LIKFDVFYNVTGLRCPSDFIAYPTLTPRDAGLPAATAEAAVADIHRLEQRFIECCRQLETAQTEWVSFFE